MKERKKEKRDAPARRAKPAAGLLFCSGGSSEVDGLPPGEERDCGLTDDEWDFDNVLQRGGAVDHLYMGRGGQKVTIGSRKSKGVGWVESVKLVRSINIASHDFARFCSKPARHISHPLFSRAAAPHSKNKTTVPTLP